MGKTGYKHTKENIKKMKLARAGQVILPHSKEAKLKISIANKGRKRPDVSKRQKENNSANKPGIRAKILKTIIKNNTFKKENNPNYGKKHPGLNKGEKNGNWNNGSSFEPYTVDWTETLKKSIRERDKYICQLCSK